ncbi:MAG: monovalent cation:proton antiporter-2 (CPA2) family protein [Phyllobacterium sp.]
MTIFEENLYMQALLFLGGAVIAAPLFKRFGLGTVLGYLAVGILIGPITNLVDDGEQVLDFSEIGVVFLLFLIGLELKPARLWSLRHAIFGLGVAQVVLTGAVLTVLAERIVGFDRHAAIIIGFGLALSSTAFAMQVLDEKSETSTHYGQKAFAILLLQDLAIVPLLALIHEFSAYASPDETTVGLHIGVTIFSIALMVTAGRYLLNPMFRIIGNTGAREVMIAFALFVVLGAAMLMQYAGLSMAMGAFVAGVLLAESSYRHELEADIEPFRGIFLGLFFIAVGLSLDLDVILQNWFAILLAVPAFMIVKAGILYLVCRIFGSQHNDAVRIAFLLPQGGEFGFVLFSTAASAAIVTQSVASQLIAVITLSMALTPLAVWLGRRLLTSGPAQEHIHEDFEGAGADVMMIGFARFGQIVSQILLAGGSNVTVIENSADRIRAAARFGFRIYFGDGTRRDVLEAAGIRNARLVAVCTQNTEATDKIVDLIQREFPDIKLYVRSFDRGHTLQLRAKGVDYELRETFESALLFGQKALEGLGIDPELADEISKDIRKRDEDRLHIQAAEGIRAGNDLLLTKPITPEPLIRPTKEAQPLDENTQNAVKW